MNNTKASLPEASAVAGRGGYDDSRFNAFRHGVLSRFTVLPWEDETEYRVLVGALVDEHVPDGPTEEHLVEELAGVLWRMRRLRLAEAAAHRRGLEGSAAAHRETVKAALAHLDSGQQIEAVADAIRATPADTAAEISDLDADEAMTKKTLKLLQGGNPGAYENAVAALRQDTREWWEEKLTWEPDDYDEGEEPYTPDCPGLQRFLGREVSAWYRQHRKELENRPLIRAQAFGESLDPFKLERLARYEVHLDRKLERMLAMLIRLQDLRQEKTQTDQM